MFGDFEGTAAFFDVGGAIDWVGDDGDCLNDVFDDRGLLDRVVISVFQKEIGLEADKVFCVVGQVLGDILDRILLHERVGVVFRWQHHDTDVHTFFENHIGATEGGVNASGIAVVEHGDVLGVTANHADLFGRQRGARTCNHVFDASLMH